ncbi:hypothetical protein [Fusobacterium sp.]|uniref:hypothetical protein n=1 Tax=Fusobacterium sp. TaxID=68766 RepID=UPI0028FE58D2|nr:hypothetical protein [Fusobacterium sp.]MDU1912077.1 hypothetical protein [Fusobacterium sp.]
MNNIRSTRKQPFCWQEKKILRVLRCSYNGAELQKLRNLYLTLTEIYSDFNGQDIKYYTETIAKYSGLSRAWIPKGLKIFEELKVILLIEDKVGGRFKGKKLVFTPENLKEINIKTVVGETVDGKTVNGKSVDGFLKTSEDSLLLEDNKRTEDINNTHTEKQEEKVIEKIVHKEEKLSNAPVEIQQILKKYCDLGLPDFNYRPDNYILLGIYRELGAGKLFEALTLMSQSQFVKNNMSVNAIFKIENLKKALNGNFKDKTGAGKKSVPDTKKEFKEPVYENFTGDFIKSLLKGTAGGE